MATTQTQLRTPSRFLPLLALLFAASGCAALIYELIWYQMLQLAIGSQSVCLGFLLAAFMGGLCLGSLALPRYFARSHSHPLRVYAALEAATGVTAVLVLWLMPLAQHVFFAASLYGLPGMLLRSLLSAVMLLPPTILMGASLPALVRWVESSAEGVAWWGFLYGANIAGAVLGCLGAGFYLLRFYNVTAATWFAAAINLAVALGSWALAARTAAPAVPAAPPAPARSAGPSLAPVYITIALSGATALGAEVIWTRNFGMLFGNTVYALSLILATFLLGMGLGSAGGASLSKRLRPRFALGWSQICLVLGIFWTSWMIADSLPYWPINPFLTTSPYFTFQTDLVRCLWAILPPAVFWGASFPLALAAAAGPESDPGVVVGRVYAANTFGGIVGALSVSLWLIPAIGTQNAERLLLILAAISALVVLVPDLRRQRSPSAAAWLAVALGAAVFLTVKTDKIPGELIAYGRQMAIQNGDSKVLDTVEGRNSSIAITRYNDGAVEVDVNGHVEATTEPYDMKLQRMVSMIPALIHPHPVSVLGIGFGAGVSAGGFTRFPTIKKITICEIEPKIPPTSTKYFANADYDVFHNPKTHMVYDDARHFILTTNQKFDVIASDPLDVFVKGTADIYSLEYFQAVRRHLNPGGFFTLYVPLYESDVTTIKSELATFFAVFPHGTVWGNTVNGQGYDMVFMGQAGPLHINLDQVTQRLQQPDYAPVVASLQQIGVNSPLDLFATYGGRASDFAAWTKGAPINRDANLRLQYLGGWGINSSLADVIWQQMEQYRRPPTGIFTGSPDLVQALMSEMQP